jgi:hypothetical protein
MRLPLAEAAPPEVKGYSQECLDASSPRSQQIREYLERTGRHSKKTAEIAAHLACDKKEIHSPGGVMAAHRRLAADFGNQADAVIRAARESNTRRSPAIRSTACGNRLPFLATRILSERQSSMNGH